MSSNDILAAKMWLWPDPMLKRDSQGRIEFVNAAFLSIYGGQVQDWHGNSVTGWPAPSGELVPSRFETRLPSPQGETIYDWLENTLDDGASLAIARDVTDLLAVPEPDPAHSSLPPQAAMMPAFTAPAQAPQQTPVAPPPAHAQSAPQPFEPAVVAETAHVEVPSYQAEPVDIPPVNIPHVEIPQFEAPEYEAPQIEAAMPMETQAPAASEVLGDVAAEALVEDIVPTMSATPLQPADRDFERRALPLENEESVLGTNWRDAVIAKAVGNALPKSEVVAEEPEAEPQSTLTKTEGPLRILLAEDNAINALLTRTLLEADGCHVDVVEDGALAVEAMKNQSYDMIFMDMRMPNMDGLESTRKIRSLPNVPKTLPIVALTANAFDDDRNACFDSGMNDFMTKPVSAEELQDMVNQWARKDQEVAA